MWDNEELFHTIKKVLFPFWRSCFLSCKLQNSLYSESFATHVFPFELGFLEACAGIFLLQVTKCILILCYQLLIQAEEGTTLVQMLTENRLGALENGDKIKLNVTLVLQEEGLNSNLVQGRLWLHRSWLIVGQGWDPREIRSRKNEVDTQLSKHKKDLVRIIRKAPTKCFQGFQSKTKKHQSKI